MDSSTIRNPFQTEIMMEHLTKESFKNKVFDFEANQEWSFAGDKPCIIDFYADWCNNFGKPGRGISRKTRHLQGRHREGTGACVNVQHPQHSLHSFCPKGWQAPDVDGSPAKRKFRPGHPGCPACQGSTALITSSTANGRKNGSAFRTQARSS